MRKLFKKTFQRCIFRKETDITELSVTYFVYIKSQIGKDQSPIGQNDRVLQPISDSVKLPCSLPQVNRKA